VNVRSFVQRTYALNQPPDAWLAGLAAAGEESFGEGLGSYALLLDARAPPSSRVRSVACVGAIAGAEKLVQEVVSTLPLSDLQQLASLAHVATARHLLSGERDDVEAVFDTRGKPLSMQGDAAKDDAVTRQLRRTALALAAVAKTAEGGALSRYKSRVDARWSILFQTQRGGDEYIVARRSVPPSFTLARLMRREREIVSDLVVGHTLKEIAYALGLSDSTVRVLAARAAQKFGVTSTRELTATARAQLQAGQ
jgi:DNA-binding CsgD family transcriptional regulator